MEDKLFTDASNLLHGYMFSLSNAAAVFLLLCSMTQQRSQGPITHKRLFLFLGHDWGQSVRNFIFRGSLTGCPVLNGYCQSIYGNVKRSIIKALVFYHKH